MADDDNNTRKERELDELETDQRDDVTEIIADQQELDTAAKLEQARQQLADIQNVQFFPDVGKFIIPEDNTWAAHEALVKDEKQGLGFSPEKYAYFDRIVAEKFGNPALFDPKHPDYAKFEGLRTNIAVLRNDTIGMYLNDGSFDPGDERFIPVIASIASALGQALNNDKWYKKYITRSFPVDIANVEGRGAAEMYKFLLETQTTPGIANTLLVNIGYLDRDWNLPPLATTPFSPENLAEPLHVKIAAASAPEKSPGFVERYLNEPKAATYQLGA